MSFSEDYGVLTALLREHAVPGKVKEAYEIILSRYPEEKGRLDDRLSAAFGSFDNFKSARACWEQGAIYHHHLCGSTAPADHAPKAHW